MREARRGASAAVLSPLAERVFSIEIVPELGASASEALKRLHFTNVETRVADGYYGWPEEAPFDAIMVTAAASHIPPPLMPANDREMSRISSTSIRENGGRNARYPQ